VSRSMKGQSRQVKNWSDEVTSRSGQGQVWSCQDRSGHAPIRSGKVKTDESQVRLC